MFRKSISVWMYLCRAPWYFKTRYHSESLIPNLVHKVWKVFVNSDIVLALLLPQCGPYHVLVFIVINRFVLFLDCIHKKIPSGLDPIYSRCLCGNLLPVIFPPMFDIGESLEECEGDLFPIEKIVNNEITFL
jgi:hypothetical protein